MAERKRLLVTFDDRSYSSLIAFSEASGISAASLVSQLVKNSINGIDRLTEVFKVEFPDTFSPQAFLDFRRRIQTDSNKIVPNLISIDDSDIESQLERLTVAKGRGNITKPKKEKVKKPVLASSGRKSGRPRKNAGDENA